MGIIKRNMNVLILGSLLVLIAIGCSKKEKTPEVPPVLVLPTVTTSEIQSITINSAVVGGNVLSDGGAAVTSRGICWSLQPDPVITDSNTTNGTGTGTFTSALLNLISDTVYHVKAYAINSVGTAYGNVLSFRTGKIPVVTITDVDGNIYPVVQIESQSWLTENLKVTHYRNGDAIANVANDAVWKNLATGAYCAYDNQLTSTTTYGNLYNWHALNDSRGLCPTGWHVPSDGEWASLAAFLGGNSMAGGKLKATGTIEAGTGLWYAPNMGATNASGFKAIPGGYRINYGTYYSIGNVAYLWSSSDTASVNAWNYVLDANNAEVSRNFNFKTNGFSVRCCKD
jgi:uncharacterized protein (TIGR02145 family)